MKHVAAYHLPEWLTFGLVLVAIFPFVGGILSAGSEILIGKKRSQTRLKRNLIITGSLLSVTGGLLGALQQGKDSYELWAYSTGANSYCYLVYTVASSSGLEFMLMNDGKYPAYDVTVGIWDTTQFKEIGLPAINFSSQDPVQRIDEMLAMEKKLSTSIAAGTVYPGGRPIWEAPIPKGDLQQYNATVWARNGIVGEEILLRKMTEGGFAAAFRVFRIPKTPGEAPSEILKEDVQPQFRKYYPVAIPW